MNKVCSLEEAIERWVKARDHLHLAYSEARPNAIVLALTRHFAGREPHLTLSTGGLVSAQAPIITEGLVDRVIASFVGDNYPTGAPNPLFQHAIDSGAVVLEEATLWTLVARLAAGAMGVPYLPVRSLLDTDLAKQPWVHTVDDGTGGQVCHVDAIRPDVTFVHGVAADEEGNVILSPPFGEASWGSLASTRAVIACVERIVDPEVIRRNQSLVKIPSHVVRGVCELPMGAHPYGLYSPISEVPGYVEDEPFILEQRRASRSPEDFAAWTTTWVHETADQAEYLGRVGRSRLHALIGAAAPETWRTISDPVDVESDAAAEELMVLAAADVIEQKVVAERFEVLMTGIGFANLAAWVADQRLRSCGASVPLMAEIGAYGYEPRPGDPFIFSHRNLPTCTWMTDVTSVLGCIVGGGITRSLGVVGAGMIDQLGNVNSSRTGSGGFLVGSGGANDIASGATELIVVLKHGASRLVERVPFVTCNGRAVSTIVTTAGVLQRDPASQRYVLTAVLAAPGSIADAVARARAGCGWDLDVAPEVGAIAPPSREELIKLRNFDPRHSFLPTQGDAP